MKTSHIHILGTGTSVPEPGNAPSSYLVKIASKAILIDSGPGIAQYIVNEGYHLEDIHTICFTHIHSDHILGLPEILFGLIHDNHIANHSINICISTNYAHFIEDELLKAWHPWFKKYQHINYRIIPVFSGTNILIDDVLITPFRVNHHESSLGYVIRTGSSSIAFSGDTDVFNINEVEKHNPEILFLDSSTCEPNKIPGHLSVQEAVRLVSTTSISKVYLTHIMPGERKKIVEFLRKRGKISVPEILLAQKGQKIPL
ncbi:MAG: hypothetical protein DRP86_06190 [Candidatus Neomarinimicrobiota bacterium]|nr:MAG: hypothetical protein DRP86_06190 [Candidatus Neomarinimicrobiota bacterium]